MSVLFSELTLQCSVMILYNDFDCRFHPSGAIVQRLARKTLTLETTVRIRVVPSESEEDISFGFFHFSIFCVPCVFSVLGACTAFGERLKVDAE